MKEIWKPVVGYEGRYEVSNKGRVASLSYRGQSGHRRVLRLARVPDGHEIVSLCDGARKTWSVHVLIVRAFIGPRPADLEIRHLDGNPSNNALSNLEYATKSRNRQDRKWHAGAAQHKLRPKDVLDIKSRFGRESIAALAREYGVTAPSISAIKRGITHRDVL